MALVALFSMNVGIFAMTYQSPIKRSMSTYVTVFISEYLFTLGLPKHPVNKREVQASKI